MTTDAGGRLRLFVAAEVPRRELESVAGRLADLRDELASARWTPVTNQHVTLKFLGAVSSDLLPAVCDTVEGVATRHRTALLRLSCLGAFPARSRARVLWLGLDDPAGRLGEIAAGLDTALASLGFPSENRAFTPHLTLARFKAPVRLPESLPAVATGREFEVGSAVLFRSRLHPHGARYEGLRSFPLGGATESGP